MVRKEILRDVLGLRGVRVRLAVPAELRVLGQAEVGEDAKDELAHEIGDFFRGVVERRHGGHDDGAGVVNAEHVFDVDAIEGRLAEAEDERAALLEADVGGAREEIVAGAGGDGAECSRGAGNYRHGVHTRAAGGDGGADVAIGEEFDFRGGSAGEKRRKFFRFLGDNAQFGGDKTQAGFTGDEIDALDAGIGVEETEDELRVDGAGRASRADGDDFLFGLSHVRQAVPR
jgi:hypothetical protein